ncbi:L-amino acid amidase [Cercospora beticola]|uniref:L-amino acid amidase n=1 Tax=Cercospora beticola TaxID=122368 RepID=A0A2G5HQ48_CERBT|nr:L-amino acid amidase [Cercospora beticola]PIA94664.1 L-amino acid amidase [Cercospora beticola]WPB04636.1 hypothetical protein RHO25_009282 [Cercospora beticola]
MAYNIPDENTPKPPGQIRSYPPPTSTGKVEFTIPSTGEKGTTIYRIWGQLSPSATPLICLHGGPGMLHNYILPISLIATDYGIPVIMYDQLGCGDNTHLQHHKGDTSFFTFDLHIGELENLKQHLQIKNFYLLGQSCGGMEAIQYAVDHQPAGLQKLIVSNSPAAMPTWSKVCNGLRAALPKSVQDALDKHEKEGTTDSKEYEDATIAFYKRHLCRVDPFPPEIEASLAGVAEDNTVYATMNGPSEFTVVGTVKDWDYTEKLKLITSETVPGGVLLINGYFDEAQDEVVWPYFNNIAARTKWVTFPLSSHTPFLEETESYMKVLGDFLQAK